MDSDRQDGRTGALKPIDALLAEIGPRWHLDIRQNSQAVKEAYEPLLQSAPKGDITVRRELSYGPHPRQRLDVFRPEGAVAAPVVAFVHGGAFVRGDKRSSEQIYDNVLYWFARQGFVGLNLEYRLAPEARHPMGAEDVGEAMAWAQRNVAEHGGDPARVLLIGHSAGGAHVASYVFGTSAFRPTHAAAVVLISARLRADRSAANPNAAGVAAYYGSDESRDDVDPPIHHAAGSDLPVFVVIAEYENPGLDIEGLEFATRLAIARRRAPRLLQARGHNHMSIVAHFNSGDEALGRSIVDFFELTRSEPSPR